MSRVSRCMARWRLIGGTLALPIASALEAAHQRGILHRDLKPANVLVTVSSGWSDPPRAKLLDFGIAKLNGGGWRARPQDLTRTTRARSWGRRRTMSPEQAEGKAPRRTVGLLQLQHLLSKMLSGPRAFAGHTSAQVVSTVIARVRPQLQTPAALNGIVRRWSPGKHQSSDFRRWPGRETALEQLSAKPANPPRVDRRSAVRRHECGAGITSGSATALAEEIINALDSNPRPQGDRAHVRVRIQRPAGGHPANRRGARCGATSLEGVCARPALASRHRAADHGRRRKPSLVGTVRSRAGRHLRHPGRHLPSHRGRALEVKLAASQRRFDATGRRFRHTRPFLRGRHASCFIDSTRNHRAWRSSP